MLCNQPRLLSKLQFDVGVHSHVSAALQHGQHQIGCVLVVPFAVDSSYSGNVLCMRACNAKEGQEQPNAVLWHGGEDFVHDGSVMILCSDIVLHWNEAPIVQGENCKPYRCLLLLCA